MRDQFDDFSHDIQRRLERDDEREPTFGARRRIPLHARGALKQHFAGVIQPPVKL